MERGTAQPNTRGQRNWVTTGPGLQPKPTRFPQSPVKPICRSRPNRVIDQRRPLSSSFDLSVPAKPQRRHVCDGDRWAVEGQARNRRRDSAVPFPRPRRGGALQVPQPLFSIHLCPVHSSREAQRQHVRSCSVSRPLVLTQQKMSLSLFSDVAGMPFSFPACVMFLPLTLFYSLDPIPDDFH